MRQPPPRFFMRFFRWYARPALADHIEGDLIEVYQHRLRTYGKWKADVAFACDVLLLLRPGIIRSFPEYNTAINISMFRSYLNIAWRNLVKNRSYASINIIGLAAGMTVALLIGIWVADELAFDKHFKNHERLAEVMINQTSRGEWYRGQSIASPVEDPIRTRFGSDFDAISLCSYSDETIVAYGDKKLAMPARWVQADFPDMFTLDMVHGTRRALRDPSTMLISRSAAKALFGDADPMNKSVRVDNKQDITIGGVYDDLPQNTSFADAMLLLPWHNKENWNNKVTDWDNHSCLLFVQLAGHANIDEVTEKIRRLPAPHIKDVKEEVTLTPLTSLHLYGTEFFNGETTDAHIQFVWLFGTIGAFVLLLACINFMNLSTARSERRAKEVGIRKTVGSIRSQLIGQFLVESVVVVLLAFMLALVLTQLGLPYFNNLAGKQTAIPWTSPLFWGVALGFALFTGILSGSYPAFYLSAFKPAKVLKGTTRMGRFAVLPRKVLVVLQFTVSVTLVICTLVIFKQVQFARNRAAGFSRDGLISITINTPELRKHFEPIRNDVMRTGAAENMTRASQSPAHFGNNNSVEWRGKDPSLAINFNNVTVTPDFGKTIGWKIKEGRDFFADTPDSTAALFNEAAIRLMGFEHPIGEQIQFGNKTYTIAGVVHDMNTQSPYDPVRPAIFLPDGWFGVMIIKLNSAMPVAEALTKIEAVFRKHNPSGPFAYDFVDQEFGRKFAAEERTGKLAAFFTVLAVFISCLGLFGLASFVAAQRTKEIGIRKVLGASVANLWQLLSKDFVTLVIVSCIVSIPIAVLVMGNWLEHYQYRTSIAWQELVGSALGAFVLTLLTVSFQAIRAAVSNPVDSLKTE